LFQKFLDRQGAFKEVKYWVLNDLLLRAKSLPG
jgi:hypothetical protein